MFENLRADFVRTRSDIAWALEREGIKGSAFLENIRVLMSLAIWANISYRFSHWVSKLHVPIVRPFLMVLAIVLQRWTGLWTGVCIHRLAEIGPGLVIHSLYGICIGPTRTGANLTVATGVLIAGESKGIGDNVYFGPGAKLIGNARIGNNVVVGANSVVLTDVPDDMTVIGVPARIRLRGGHPKRFPPLIETSP
jgi:serine O-acetyltransferase